jgi:hypothetical protein
LWGISENRIHFSKHPEIIFCSFPAISFWLHRRKISAGKACGQGLYPTLNYLSSSQYLHKKEGEAGVAHLVEKH